MAIPCPFTQVWHPPPRPFTQAHAVDAAGCEEQLVARLQRLRETIAARRHLIGGEGSWSNEAAIAVLPTGVGKSLLIALSPFAALQHNVHATK